jgi:hypothetical protein
MTKIAILGWGSLLWDDRPEFHWFDATLEGGADGWHTDGPSLKLEFSRVSVETRARALTLVLDYEHGWACNVAYAVSKRQAVEDARCDLRCREGTLLKRIGLWKRGDECTTAHQEAWEAIDGWAKDRFDAVVWTDLKSNFPDKSHFPGKTDQNREFTVENAIAHLKHLDERGKAMAAAYIWRAPPFVVTRLRTEIESVTDWPRRVD